MKEILQREHPSLKKISKEIAIQSIKSAETKKIIEEMKEALSSRKDGVAIAAPQIGYNNRIFVVAGKAFGQDENLEDKVFINPEIVSQSKKAEMMDEGCLSCQNFYGKVLRKEKTKIKAFDEKGEFFEYGGSGLISQIFQHEIDHLNGILFIEKAEDLVKIEPNEEK